MAKLLEAAGSRVLLLGNEAIARGAIEADVRFVIGYPGTPSSEILEALATVADKLGIYVNWAINEKVALETAIGVSYAGVRSLVTMKHVGVNVAADPLMTLAYTGVEGGLVLISAGDPQCHTSQTEQDDRYYALLAKIPILEPSDPQEAKDLTKEAFTISEKSKLPVILHSTPRLGHTFGDVTLGEIGKVKQDVHFKKDPERWVCVGPIALRRHKWLEGRQEEVRKLIESLRFNKLQIHDNVNIGIITVGLAYNYVLEALDRLKMTDKVNILKLCASHPVAENLITTFLEKNEKVLVIEELDPIVENYTLVLAKRRSLDTKIYGKYDGFIPLVGELTPDIVTPAVARFLGIKYTTTEETSKKIELPIRPLALCAGCPHSATYYSLKKVLKELKKEYIVAGDIGCYTIGKFPPFNIIDTCICMGASIGMASGFAMVNASDIVIGVIGDSTFLHNGIPPLINAVYNDANIKVLILDNETTAMTGHQPHPGVGLTATGRKAKKVPIEDIVRACGVEFVEVVDPYDLEKTQKVLKDAILFKGPAVVICRRECALMYKRRARELNIKVKSYVVDPDACRGCLICIKELGCPALTLDIENKKVKIESNNCVGCGVCAKICPFEAIRVKGEG